MKYIAFLIFLNVSLRAIGCDCRQMTLDVAIERDYQQSELVFLGKIVKVSHNKSYVKVLEIFKGLTDSIIEIDLSADCRPKISLGEKWLIYTSLVHGKITITGSLIFNIIVAIGIVFLPFQCIFRNVS